MQLREFFETVYVPRKLRGKSQNSIRLYQQCIKQFERTLGRAANVEDLTDDNVLRHLARRSNVAPATRNKELTELKAMWRLATQKGMLATWPEIQDEPEPEQAPIAWLQSELTRLLEACARQSDTICGIPASLWWAGLVRIIVDTGERISAVRQAEFSWLSDDWLLVPATARKGKTRDRRYKLHADTIALLDAIRAAGKGSGLIFPWDRTPNSIWARYAKVIESAGLPTGRKHSFHAVRKTHGSVIYAAGLDPQEALDHTDRRTTQKYIDPRFVQKTHASDVLASYLRGDHWESPPQQKRESA